MTNLLFPTDFSPASLQLVEQAIHAMPVRAAHVLLFHAFEMPASEYELLAPGRTRPYADVLTDSFRQACKQLKERYPQAIRKICFKCLEGSTSRVFRNFIEANEIDLIVCPDDYRFKPVKSSSVDPRPLFRKSGIPVFRSLTRKPEERLATRRELETAEAACVATQ